MTQSEKIAQFCKLAGVDEAKFIADNLTVGGSLDLRGCTGLTTLPDNLTVGGSLDLEGCTGLNDVGESKCNPMQPFIINNNNILCDGIVSKLISRKGNVMRVINAGSRAVSYLVTDGNGKYAHGDSMKDAREALLFKINDRNTSYYKDIDINAKMPFAECVIMYRVITGACESGVRNFLSTNNVSRKKYSVKDMARITNGAYGSSEFKNFFNI